jgi:hypothetical protein
MVDDSQFRPEDDPAAPSSDSGEQLATPQQWAAMTFSPVVIDAGKFGTTWEQTRGSMARAAIELLSLDDQELTRHFMEQDEPLLEAMTTHTNLQDELDYLRTHLEALEMAATRMLCVASRLSLGL